jgi:putative peptidoglycan lipid II flippase
MRDIDRGSGRSGAMILALSGLTLTIGFAVQVVLAARLGTGRAMDILMVALTVPTLLAALSLGVSTLVVVPLVSGRLVGEGADAADRLGARLVRLAALIGLGIAVGIGAGAPWVIRWTAPGFDAASAATAATLLRVMAFGSFFDIVRGVLSAVHYAHQRFFLPQLAPSLNHLCMLLAALVALPGWGLPGLAYGWALGSLFMCIILLPGRRVFPSAGGDGMVRGHGGLLLAGIVWSGSTQLVPIVDRAVASFLPVGSIAVLGYGSKLMEILLRTAPMALALTGLPLLSRKAAAADGAGFDETLARNLRWTLLTAPPLAATVAVLRSPLVSLLFERGAFGRSAVAGVSPTVGLYALAVVPAALAAILSNGLFARRRHTVLSWIGVGAVLAVAAGDAVFARLIGVTGVPVSYTCVSIATAVGLAVALGRAAGAPRYVGLTRPALHVAVALVPCVAVAWLASRLLGTAAPGTARLLVGTPSAFVLAMAVYFVTLAMMGNEEVRTVTRAVSGWRG